MRESTYVCIYERSLKIHNTSGSVRYLIVMWQSTPICILAIAREILEKSSLVPHVGLERKLGSQKYGIFSEFLGHE